MFMEGSTIFPFSLQRRGFDFALARGSPASVSDDVMTIQDHTKDEYVRLHFFARILQMFRQFSS